jgi:multiple sugar transport system ATP-binding protein
MWMSNIRLRNVTKRFGSTVTLHQVNLDIEDGEFAVFVGPSGCGKSTLLRMIAGLEEVSEGEVLIGDEVMNDVARPPRRGDGLPVLCALSAHDGGGEYGLWAEGE